MVLREEAPREVDGKTVVGYQDHLHEITVGGENYPARWFGILKQSHQLFWNQMSGYHHEYGTICDRDYKIRRIGGSIDTTYQIIPREPVIPTSTSVRCRRPTATAARSTRPRSRTTRSGSCTARRP